MNKKVPLQDFNIREIRLGRVILLELLSLVVIKDAAIQAIPPMNVGIITVFLRPILHEEMKQKRSELM